MTLPYLVLRGAKATVKTPDGKIARHAFQKDTVFLNGETLIEGRAFEFEKDGYRLVIDPSDVKPIVFTCKKCGSAMKDEQGVCESCQELEPFAG